uniref:Endonuclease for mating-type switching n=1 Tax=Nakaseomyces delphensis TaxID=51657 RepID=Q707W4_NAKDE|nr:endonuclease for mating-type switching [Nakaseomyces delphensis]
MFDINTTVVMANGEIKKVCELTVNSLVMCDDGTPARITHISSAHHTTYEIYQKTKHRANEGEPGRLDPRRKTVYQRLGFNCTGSHLIPLRVPAIACLENSTIKPNLTVRWRCLEDVVTNDGRLISIPKNHHKNFPKTQEGFLLADNFIKERSAITGDYIDYLIEVRDLDYLDTSMRVTSALKCSPILCGNGILSKFLSGKPHLITPSITAMAWLLGLWIGDGTTKEPEITMDSLDAPLMNSLIVLGRKWGIYPTYKDEKVPLRAKHVRLYYGNEPEEKRKTRNLRKNNPFWNTVLALGFKKENSGEKYVPEFMWTEDIEIREAFLAGLIDSDGYVSKRKDNPDVYKVSIQTIYPCIMDAVVHIARSLGISATVTTRSARPEVIEGRLVNCQFTYDCNISGSSALQNVLSYCRSGHKRRKAPESVIREPQFFGFIDKKISEADVKGIHFEDERNILLGNKVVAHCCKQECLTEGNRLLDTKKLKYCVSCPRSGVRYFYRDWTGKNRVCGRCYGRYKFSGYRCVNCMYVPEAREVKKAKMKGEELGIDPTGIPVRGICCPRCSGILNFDEIRGPSSAHRRAMIN